MRDQDLFLVERLDDVAFRFERDEVILAEIFADDANGGHFSHDASHVDVFAGDRFDDLVVVALEIFYVFVGDAVFDEIVVVL